VDRWLVRYFPWQWAIYWLIVPNLALILMWPWGGPPMGKPLLIAGCVGLICSQAPGLWVRRISAVVLTLAMFTFYIARNFNLDPAQIAFAPTYLREGAPLLSLRNGAAALALAVSLVTLWIFVGRVHRFAVPMNWLMGFLAVTGVINFDTYATASTRGSYDVAVAPVRPESATALTGHARPGPGRRNLVIVLVEALGVPTSPAASRLFRADWNRPEWRNRYAVSTGTVPYFGSTTNAEMRELCGAPGLTAVDLAKADCLPQRFARAGYETTAIHAFSRYMFDRVTWWPEIGFQHSLFRRELMADGARMCGGVFPGVCDDDIPSRIGARLKAAHRPQLVYWVTVNSHLPVVQDASLGTQDCAYGGAGLAVESTLLCPLFLVHHRLSDAITRMALDPGLPPTDILIIGDHMPPFFERDARMRFEGHVVPWILLEARGGTKGHAPGRS
jgi:hypothetical protein